MERAVGELKTDKRIRDGHAERQIALKVRL